MGLADYMSRNSSEPAKPPSKYGENFIIAQIDVKKETLKSYAKEADQRNSTITKHSTTQKRRKTIPMTLQKYNGLVQRFQHFFTFPIQTTERQAQKSLRVIVKRFHTNKIQYQQTRYDYKQLTKE